MERQDVSLICVCVILAPFLASVSAYTYAHLHITKPTHIPNHTLQNKLKQPEYKIHLLTYSMEQSPS